MCLCTQVQFVMKSPKKEVPQVKSIPLTPLCIILTLTKYMKLTDNSLQQARNRNFPAVMNIRKTKYQNPLHVFVNMFLLPLRNLKNFLLSHQSFSHMP